MKYFFGIAVFSLKVLILYELPVIRVWLTGVKGRVCLFVDVADH